MADHGDGAAAAGSRVVCATASRGERSVTGVRSRWPAVIGLQPSARRELAACLRILGVNRTSLVGLSGWRLR